MRQLFGALAIALLTAACGPDNGKFRLEGRLRNLNQAEFYVYSPMGDITGLDTIRVRDGRFAYEVELREPATLAIIFPNYSEQAVFGQPGATAKVKGDASHLKEIEITGTEDNQLMTRFRQQANRLTPPEVVKAAEAFIREHPQSPVSRYLLRRHFVLAEQPDYRRASELAALMLKQTPDDGRLLNLKKQLDQLKSAQPKSQLPAFTATDVQGKRVTLADLKGTVNVVSLWASWDYRSNDMQRRLRQLKTKHGDRLAILSICIDGRPSDCLRTVTRDSLRWSTVCDGRMWQTPLVGRFGMSTVPSNIIADAKGRILDRDVANDQLERRIDQLIEQGQ